MTEKEYHINNIKEILLDASDFTSIVMKNTSINFMLGFSNKIRSYIKDNNNTIKILMLSETQLESLIKEIKEINRSTDLSEVNNEW